MIIEELEEKPLDCLRCGRQMKFGGQQSKYGSGYQNWNIQFCDYCNFRFRIYLRNEFLEVFQIK